MEPLLPYEIRLYNGFNQTEFTVDPNYSRKILTINNLKTIVGAKYPDVDMWGIRIVILDVTESSNGKLYTFNIEHGVEETSMDNSMISIVRRSVGSVKMDGKWDCVYEVSDVFGTHYGYVTDYNLSSPNRLMEYFHYILSNK